MAMIKLHTEFFPLALRAQTRSNVELRVVLENTSDKFLWVELDVSVPNEISLSPVKELTLGKARFGILKPGQLKEKKIKIYSGVKTVKYEYKIQLTLLAYDEDAVIADRKEENVYLRAEDV